VIRRRPAGRCARNRPFYSQRRWVSLPWRPSATVTQSAGGGPVEPSHSRAPSRRPRVWPPWDQTCPNVPQSRALQHRWLGCVGGSHQHPVRTGWSAVSVGGSGGTAGWSL
jgi:hypothetical protein